MLLNICNKMTFGERSFIMPLKNSKIIVKCVYGVENNKMNPDNGEFSEKVSSINCFFPKNSPGLRIAIYELDGFVLIR